MAVDPALKALFETVLDVTWLLRASHTQERGVKTPEQSRREGVCCPRILLVERVFFKTLP